VPDGQPAVAVLQSSALATLTRTRPVDFQVHCQRSWRTSEGGEQGRRRQHLLFRAAGRRAC